MIWTLFIIGALTALGCGGSCIGEFKREHWPLLLIWLLGGFGGAGLMVLALFLRKWGF